MSLHSLLVSGFCWQVCFFFLLLLLRLFPYMSHHIYLLLLKFSLVSSCFKSFIIMCFNMNLLFVLARVHWPWMCRFMHFIKLWLFGHYFFQILPHPFIPLLLSSPPVMYVVRLTVSHRSHGLSSFFFILLSFCSSDWTISIDLSSVFMNFNSACSDIFLNEKEVL